MWLQSPTGSVSIGSNAGTLQKRGYIEIRLDKKVYKAHRLAWLYVTGKWPKDQIDHINHARDDNRWVNLQEADNKSNAKNRASTKANGDIIGVYWNKSRLNWRAAININGKRTFLGSYTDKFDAICARLSANNKYGYHENHGK